MLVAEVWEAPEVAKTDGIPNEGEDSLLAVPVGATVRVGAPQSCPEAR